MFSWEKRGITHFVVNKLVNLAYHNTSYLVKNNIIVNDDIQKLCHT